MFKTRLFSKYILGFLSLIASFVWLAVASFPKDKLEIIFCNVGQGDAALITKGFNQILIDGGPNDQVLECLADNMPFGDQKIEMIILTHPEADHLTGLLTVLAKYQVDYFFTGPEANSSAKYQVLVEKLKSLSEKTRVRNIFAGEEVRLGEIVLQSVWPEKSWLISKLEPDWDSSLQVLGAQTTDANFNDFSLVFLLDYQGKKVLFMGDADSEVQNKMIGIAQVVNSQTGIDLLKFPHHGSKTGISEEFFKQIKPKEVVISVGKNSYGHPTQEALDLLEKFKVKVRRTDIEGDIKYNF